MLEGERQLDLEKYPDRYSHVWVGDYARAFEGAYFAKVLNEARQQGRIGKVSADPLLPISLFWDIGGAGAKADACAIWVVQWVAHEIRVLDYIEGQGQVLGYYTNELRHRGYDKAICVLPHDGVNTNMVTGLRYADHLRDAEFKVEVIPNQGAALPPCASRRCDASSPRCGSTRRPRKPAAMRSGFTMRRRTRAATWTWGPSTTGQAMLRTFRLDGHRLQGAERLCPLQSSA